MILRPTQHVDDDSDKLGHYNSMTQLLPCVYLTSNQLTITQQYTCDDSGKIDKHYYITNVKPTRHALRSLWQNRLITCIEALKGMKFQISNSFCIKLHTRLHKYVKVFVLRLEREGLHGCSTDVCVLLKKYSYQRDFSFLTLSSSTR